MKNFWQKNKSDIYIQLYDDFASSLKTDDELAFLKNQFLKRQKIIEFGCGTGRTLLPLLKDGYQISGLDFSKGMLEHLQEKLDASGLAAQIFNKNLINFSLKNKYDGGVLSQRTLNFITTQNDQKKAILNVAKSLKKGAILIVNLMPARPNDFTKKQVKLKKTGSFKNSATGEMVEFWENWLPNQMDQTWELTNKFVEKNKSVTTEMKMRVVFEAEMRNLLELCGFKVLQICGSWKGKKYDEKSLDLIFIAEKV